MKMASKSTLDRANVVTLGHFHIELLASIASSNKLLSLARSKYKLIDDVSSSSSDVGEELSLSEVESLLLWFLASELSSKEGEGSLNNIVSAVVDLKSVDIVVGVNSDRSDCVVLAHNVNVVFHIYSVFLLISVHELLVKS